MTEQRPCLDLLAANQRIDAAAEVGVALDEGAEPPAGEGASAATAAGNDQGLVEVQRRVGDPEETGALRELRLPEGPPGKERPHAAHQARHGGGEQLAEGGEVVEPGWEPFTRPS